MSVEFDAWFTREILAHEAALLRYLSRNWSQREELHDFCQEVYARVYEAAARQRPAAPLAFLLTSARHLVIDRARRGRVVSIETMGDFPPSHVYPVDELSPERWLDSRQMLQRLAQALDALPDRCREVVWLRRVEELSQKEVAARLGISGKTVEKHLAKGMRLLANRIHGAMHGAMAPPDVVADWDEDDADARQQAD